MEGIICLFWIITFTGTGTIDNDYFYGQDHTPLFDALAKMEPMSYW